MLTPKRFFYLMVGVNIALVLLLVGITIIGKDMIKEESDKLVKAKTQNQVIERQQIQLNQAKKDIGQYQELNEISKSIVPQDKDQAKTVREITKLAQESGITLKGITFPVSNLGEFTAPTPAPVTTENTESTATAPPQPSAPPVSQLTPAEGINGVFAMEIVVSSLETDPIPYENFLRFLEKLESNRRTAHVQDISVKPLGSGESVSFVLTLNAYVKP